MSRRLAAALVIAAAAPRAAHADRREASLHGHLLGGVATIADADAVDDRPGRAPLAGLAVRASRAPDGRLGNHLQLDAALAVLATGGAGFRDGHFAPTGRPPVDGPYTIATQAVRLDAGATLRLGVAWIPIVCLAAGVQARRRGPPQLTSQPGADTGRGADYTADLIGSAAVGLDHRPHRRLVVGVALGGTGTSGFHTLELSVHAAYYWYPRN